MANAKFSFLEQQILTVLENSGLGKLSEKNKEIFLPQLSAEAEYRLGAVLMQKLSEQQIQELVKLTDRGASAKEIEAFWVNNVPNFAQTVSQVMQDFGKECLDILSKISQ